jgi:hypothetical protein
MSSLSTNVNATVCHGSKSILNKGRKIGGVSVSETTDGNGSIPRTNTNETTTPPTVSLSTTVFGLEDQAKAWVAAEENRLKLSYLQQHGQQYIPFNCSTSTGGGLTTPTRPIPAAHFIKAGAEYARRSKSNSNTIPVLVATGVSLNWTPSEEIGKARFLLIPRVASDGSSSALFLTYMPGPEHGAADSSFSNDLGYWLRQNPILEKHIISGQSSGGYGCWQPDKRVFPKKNFRDRQGRDADKSNQNHPHSRLIWEIEYDNRDPVELRQRGKKYMVNSYTRLFLAAKFYKPEGGAFEAAIVLWGKTQVANNVVSVMEAVEFGTKVLSDDHKQEFFECRHDRLPGVDPGQWRRPDPLVNPDSPTPASWKVNIPVRDILYKVTTDKNEDGTRRYLVDVLQDAQLEDLTVDLRHMWNSMRAANNTGGDGSESD